MKILFLILALAYGTSFAQERVNTGPVSSSPNPASQGSSNRPGSDSPLGPNEQEKQEARKRSSSMGGAPNVGGGMGTGTGAGSKVGKPVEGRTNAGAPVTD